MSVATDPRSEQSYWDRRYAEWWDLPFHGMTQDSAEEMAREEHRILGTLEPILRPDHRVLDAACGYGRLAPMICPHVREYVGVDFAWVPIAAARDSAPANARFVESDLLDFTADPFDVIVMAGASSSLESRWDDVTAHLRSLLNPDGRLFVFEATGDTVIRGR